LDDVLGGNRRPDNIALCQSRTIAELGKQVAAEQGSACLFVKNAGVPTVGNMRRVDVTDPLAKEYIAAQDPNDPGVLILSRFAGAAAELTGALLVNPYDPETVATSLSHALSMSLDER